MKQIEMKDYEFAGVSKNIDPPASPVMSLATWMDHGPANGGQGLPECVLYLLSSKVCIKTRLYVFR